MICMFRIKILSFFLKCLYSAGIVAIKVFKLKASALHELNTEVVDYVKEM